MAAAAAAVMVHNKEKQLANGSSDEKNSCTNWRAVNPFSYFFLYAPERHIDTSFTSGELQKWTMHGMSSVDRLRARQFAALELSVVMVLVASMVSVAVPCWRSPA
jgi:hypothetical protein